jgi:hypothetical protein
MLTRSRVLLVLVVIALCMGWVDQAFAGFGAGGSRLIYYYRETSFTSGAGLTLFTVTNNQSSPVSVQFAIFNGADCSKAGPFTTTVGATQTKMLTVTDFAPAASFPAGVIDLWAVNGANQPIRWDVLTGTSVVADFGPGPVGAVTIPAAKIFSDDRSANLGTLIANQGDVDATGPLAIAASLLTPQSPGTSDDTLVLFSPATNPGEVPPPSTGSSNIDFTLFPSAGGAGTPVSVETSCVYTNTATGIFGPGVGTGHVQAIGGGGKGIVGWKFLKFSQNGLSVLLGELMPVWATVSLSAAAQ